MLSQRAWTDRLIPIPNGVVIFLEFKRVGEKPTPLQEELHEYLRSMGHIVKVFDDADEAFAFVKSRLEEPTVKWNVFKEAKK